MAAKRKTSKVWNFFTVSEDTPNGQANCNSCKNNVSRGGTTIGNYTTTNLVNHLKRHHPEEAKELNKQQNESTEEEPKPKAKSVSKNIDTQLTLHDTVPWTNTHREALKYNRLVAKMIAKDNQPFFVVEDDGFRDLIAHALPRYTMPGKT
jgi:hypothetical protein